MTLRRVEKLVHRVLLYGILWVGGSQLGSISRLAAMLLALIMPGMALAQAVPELRIDLAPGAVDQAAGRVDLSVALRLSDARIADGAALFTHQNMAPRMTGPIRIDGLDVTDASGAVPLIDDGKTGQRGWNAGRAISGELTIRYRVAIDNGTGGGLSTIPRVDGPGFFGVGNMLLLVPQVPGRHRIALHWNLSALPKGTTAISTFGEGDQILPPGPLSRLTFAMLMAGDVKRVQSGPFGVYWTGAPKFDVAAASAWTGDLYRWMSSFFADPALPRYSVFLRANPSGNGVAAPFSFALGYGDKTTAEGMRTILGHEMTHTWTANDLGKWYSEGNAVFYQSRLPWLAGMIDSERYLRDINLTAARYYSSDVIAAPDERILPNFWSDMRYNVLSYDRGAIYFALLDARIRAASRGRRSVDDLVRAMVERTRKDQPIAIEHWLALLRKELGEAGPRLHRAMMRGERLVPPSNAYGPCFRRVPTKIRRFDLGFGGPEIMRRTLVENLRPDSEAAKAGLREGDRVDYASSTEGAQRDPEQTVTMQVTRGDTKFEITYLPRGAAVDGFQWERIPGVPETTCRNIG
jgi:predicted metalloprotease with PDZ domain